MEPRVIALYNEYIHGTMPRRAFITRLAEIAGGTAAALSLLAMLEPDWARGQQVDPEDPRLEAGYISYPGATGLVRGYAARLAGTDRLPAVLVIHENRGLNAHLEDVARRAAIAGYLALAPDGLSFVGGAPSDPEAARDRFAAADPATILGDLLAAVPYLASRSDATGKVGTVGFCYGGGVSLLCASTQAQTTASVCFYGRALTEAELQTVQAPLLMHYAGSDERINASIPEFRAALDRRGVSYSINMYPRTNHGFHNDTSEARYDSAAAKLAWRRTLEFFDYYLRG